MERPELDKNPYSLEQLSYIRSKVSLIEGVYSELDQAGLVISSVPGRFSDIWSLWVDGFNWMNTNPIDFLDHKAIAEASGSVLLTGLGLGLGVLLASANPDVSEITVLEKDQRIIDHIWPMIEPHSRATTLIFADADSYEPSAFDFAYLDHAETAIAPEVKDAYLASCSQVATWYEEYAKVLESW